MQGIAAKGIGTAKSTPTTSLRAWNLTLEVKARSFAARRDILDQ